MNKITLKNKILTYISPLLLQTKNIEDLCLTNIDTIYVKLHHMNYLIHSSFNVVYIEGVDEKDNNVKGYFRECRPHLNPQDYINNIFDDYFLYVYKYDDGEDMKEEIKSYYDDSDNLKKLMNLGVKNDPNSLVSTFFKNPVDSSVVGIPNNHSHKLDSELKNIFQFIWGEIYLYNLNRGVGLNNFQTFSSNRQIATYKLADYFDMKDIIPNTRYIYLKDNYGNMKFGTLMDIASGTCPEKLSFNERKKINPIFQVKCNQLCILDLICRQTDHRPGHDGNYNVDFNENGEIVDLCAFDNDAPTSFIPSSKINFVTSAKTTPYINNKYIIQFPFFSKSLAEKILMIKKSEIDLLLNNYLSYIQRYYIWKRIKKIKKALKKSIYFHALTLLDDNQWSKKTIDDELKICEKENRASYLYSFINLLY